MEISQRNTAMITGIALLMMAASAFYATNTLSRLTVQDTNHLMSAESILRASIVAWLVILVTDIIVAWGLHVLLRKTNENLSLLTAWLRLIYTAFLGIAISSLVFCLVLFNESYGFYKEIEVDQVKIALPLFVDAFKQIWSMGLIIFGFHLLGLGVLVLETKFIPKILGILIVIASIGYLITNGCNILSSTYDDYKFLLELVFILPMIAGEMGLALWLILKGGRVLKYAPLK